MTAAPDAWTPQDRHPGGEAGTVTRQASRPGDVRGDLVVLRPAPPAAVPDLAGPVLLVGSSGGHLAQLLSLQPWWSGKPHEWVTLDTPDAVSLLSGEAVTWAHHPVTRSIPNLLRNTVLALRLLRRSRPSVIVSTGAAVALPFFALGKLMGIPTVYVEVYDRIDSRTMTGRLCRPLSSVFFVQWPSQLELYPGSVLLGPLL